MKITYQEWLKATHDFDLCAAIALRMARLADFGAEVVELGRGERYLDGYKITELVKKHFPETHPEDVRIDDVPA